MRRVIFKKSPFDNLLVQTTAPAILKGYYSHPRIALTAKQANLMADLFIIIKSNIETSERCLGFLFYYGPYSKEPLMPIFTQYSMKKRIHVFYGDIDWMDKERAMKMVKNLGIEVDIDIIDNCEHQINYQKPLYVSKIVIENRDRTMVMNDLDTFEQEEYIKKRDEKGFNVNDYKKLIKDSEYKVQRRMRLVNF